MKTCLGIMSVLLGLSLLAGCATTRIQPVSAERSYNASPDAVLSALGTALVMRGFTVPHANVDLCELRAELAARPPWQVSAHCTRQAGATRLMLEGQHGHQPIAAPSLARLLDDTGARLDAP
ncbi:hypothetical protein [Larsenimonas rhizosphaerae]|uniref:Lipoprotein n=1 Tax=Larsenimonas rhizosphaerae TaxID=2944682 RepID=A0AA41ZFU6_9GAMM|nr:hypothetical protein [Larsenimonas rhizosphaerae]MCX2524484.1 hypothetical protein [Larsenimonas rhizosphaerae]